MAVLPTPGSPIRARQNLDDALDLHLTSDHGVEFFLLGLGGQVGGELVHQRSLGICARRGGLALLRTSRRSGGRRGGFVQYAAGLAADLFRGHAQAAQDFHRAAFHTHQPEQDVLGANVVMAEAAGLIHGEFQDLLGVGGQFDLLGIKFWIDHGNTLDDLAHAAGDQAQLTQDTPRNAAFFIH